MVPQPLLHVVLTNPTCAPEAVPGRHLSFADESLHTWLVCYVNKPNMCS